MSTGRSPRDGKPVPRWSNVMAAAGNVCAHVQRRGCRAADDGLGAHAAAIEGETVQFGIDAALHTSAAAEVVRDPMRFQTSVFDTA